MSRCSSGFSRSAHCLRWAFFSRLLPAVTGWTRVCTMPGSRSRRSSPRIPGWRHSASPSTAFDSWSSGPSPTPSPIRRSPCRPTPESSISTSAFRSSPRRKHCWSRLWRSRESCPCFRAPLPSKSRPGSRRRRPKSRSRRTWGRERGSTASRSHRARPSSISVIRCASRSRRSRAARWCRSSTSHGPPAIPRSPTSTAWDRCARPRRGPTSGSSPTPPAAAGTR